MKNLSISPFALAFLLLPLCFMQDALAAKYRCADGTITQVRSVCDSRGGLAQGGICGNGIIEIEEVCDDGPQNSDLERNGCRTDCRRAYCGDGVIDSGEQCDSSELNNAMCSDFDAAGHVLAKNADRHFWGGSLSCDDACRYKLTACQYCGDGVVQPAKEQCDDGNNQDDDGCNRDCTACTSLSNNIDVSSDTEVCTKEYAADDYGDLGVIIVKAPNLVVDCDGARLHGQGDGIGIYIKRSDKVTVKNCIIDNYEFGIYAEDSNNIIINGMGNKITNTQQQVVLDNSTAAPAPPPQRVGIGMPATAQQVLQSKQVTSTDGDAMKKQAAPGAMAASKSLSVNSAATSTRQPHVQLPTKTQPKIATTQQSSSMPGQAPLITSPKSGQQFTAPATVNATARYDSKRRLVYVLHRLPDKTILKRSRNGSFTELGAGQYCVEAMYAEKGEKPGPCVDFSVTNPLKVPPLAPMPRTLH